VKLLAAEDLQPGVKSIEQTRAGESSVAGEFSCPLEEPA
jgi:hypothetical protein